MAFESNNFYVARKQKLPVSEFNVECNISIEEEISKIFSVSAQVAVESKEVLPGMVSYSGIIESCVVYITENGEIGSTHATCPFSSKFESPNILADQKALIVAKILSYNVGNITNSGINITYTIEQSGFVIGNEEVKSVATSDEDFAVKEDEIKVIRFVGDCESTFNSVGQLSLRDKIKKLLLCESQASIKGVEPGLNFVSVSGEVVSRVLYITENDKFESAYVFDSFKEEVELEGVSRDSQIEANAFVRYSEVKAVVDNAENGSKIELTVPVDLCVMAYDEVEVKVISDLYSTKNEILIATDSFNMTKVLPFEIVEGKIDGTLIIDDDKPRVDKILFSCGNYINIMSSEVNNEIVTITGIAKANVTYLNDETSSLQSVELEIPFVLNERVNLPNDAELSTFATITDVDVAVKKGRELFYDAKIKVFVKSDKVDVSAVISNVNISDQLPVKDFAMEIIFGKQGQDLWDIAKAHNVRENMIATQNPEVIFPLANDSELVIFYQSTKNIKIS